MTQTLYIFRGLPGSGKSTIAKGMLDKGQGNIVCVERDMLRDQLFNNRYYSIPDSWSGMTEEEFSNYLRGREDTITKVSHAMVEAALSAGKSVIVSDTNLPAKIVKSWISMANKHKIAYEIVNFDNVSLEECIKRDSLRKHKVGEEVIRKMAERHLVRGKLRPVSEEVVAELAIEPYDNPEHLPSAIIVDIDGTMAIMSDRSPYDWARVGEDQPVQAVIDAVKAGYKAGNRIIVMSGRDSSCRFITLGWLKSHLGPDMPFRLHMRAEDDNRKDNIVKYELFNDHVRNEFRVAYVLDDRDQVVKMWRELGLACFQVNYGAF